MGREGVLCKTFPHLSDVINSFCGEVDGFVKRLKAQSLNPGGTEVIMRSNDNIGERVTQRVLTGCRVPDNNILDTPSFTYKDVTNVNGVLESQFDESMYASSENYGSEHPSGGSALDLDEEYSGGDDEAPTLVEIVQDNGSRNSSSHGTLHETTETSATGIFASDKSDESTTWSQTQAQLGNIFPILGDDDESMRTDDGENDKNHSDPTVSADILFRPEEGNQGGEEYSSEVEHSEEVEEEEQPQEKEKEEGGGVEEEEEMEEEDEEEDEDELDKRNDNSRMQASKKQAQQGASKKRHAPSRKPPKKRTKTNPETQVRALDSTRTLELSLGDLPELPRGTIEPHAVYLMLRGRCQHHPEEDLRLLTKLFFLIGSPSAVAQVQDAVLTIRRQMVSRTQNPTSMAHISHWLDQVELSAPLARRYGIISLSQRRRELDKWHKDQNGLRQSSRRRKSMKSNMPPRGGGTEGGGSTASKTDTAALHDLVVECYPHLRMPVRGSPNPQDDEFVRKKSQLQYRLSAARNYVLLQETISTGAVALIPIEGISAAK
ncbi:hypothetical protein LTR84_012420 [Exophiala bonariae]|uniref:Uncharacterized protein n=1 Tax=Exophiala bonariae TaxID=1690606 RepID=A0AAV9MRP4_9EURO|nr:hypothetical protein LTR84_012420 [Exophiala bonariae]